MIATDPATPRSPPPAPEVALAPKWLVDVGTVAEAETPTAVTGALIVASRSRLA